MRVGNERLKKGIEEGESTRERGDQMGKAKAREEWAEMVGREKEGTGAE